MVYLVHTAMRTALRVSPQSAPRRRLLPCTRLLGCTLGVRLAVRCCSYLTSMDKFVIVNLAIQFFIAFVSWVTGGAFGELPEGVGSQINLMSLLVLPCVLLGATVSFFRGAFSVNREWPDTLLREEEGVVFHPFETFLNVFPAFEPGQANPTKLTPKEFGAGARQTEYSSMQLGHAPWLAAATEAARLTGASDEPGEALDTSRSTASITEGSGRRYSALL